MTVTFNKQSREGGYTFVTNPELPGFSFMLEPNENDIALMEAAERFKEVYASYRNQRR